MVALLWLAFCTPRCLRNRPKGSLKEAGNRSDILEELSLTTNNCFLPSPSRPTRALFNRAILVHLIAHPLPSRTNRKRPNNATFTGINDLPCRHLNSTHTSCKRLIGHSHLIALLQQETTQDAEEGASLEAEEEDAVDAEARRPMTARTSRPRIWTWRWRTTRRLWLPRRPGTKVKVIVGASVSERSDTGNLGDPYATENNASSHYNGEPDAEILCKARPLCNKSQLSSLFDLFLPWDSLSGS